MMPEMHLLIVLFGMILVSPINTILVQMKDRFNAHFSWDREKTFDKVFYMGNFFFITNLRSSKFRRLHFGYNFPYNKKKISVKNSLDTIHLLHFRGQSIMKD